MEIVININENIYHRFVNGFANEDDAYLIEQLFKTGKVLPKGHGDLIDRDKLEKDTEWDEYGVEFISYSHCQIFSEKFVVIPYNTS